MLIPGAGHIYLGFIKNGIIILVITAAMGLTFRAGITPVVPEPFDSLFYLVAFGFFIWQIWDAYKECKKLNIGQTQTQVKR